MINRRKFGPAREAAADFPAQKSASRHKVVEIRARTAARNGEERSWGRLHHPISGDKDQNYQEILKTSAEWEKKIRFDYRFFDVPGMAHVNAGPAALEEALKWPRL